MRKYVFLLTVAGLSAASAASAQGVDSARVAGFRASRILGSYPNRVFPTADYWVATGRAMAAKFSSCQPAAVWIVSLYQSNGITQLNFPAGGNYPFITSISADQNDSYLSRFDAEGFKIWLQVEPGEASIDTLISIVLNRYRQHPCVAGFGIDVEWYKEDSVSAGRKVTDAEAQEWEARVKAVNPNYTLYLKHYGQSWMPPTYRGNILFVDDSQQFTSFTQMVNEFHSWAGKFQPNRVGFQFGYAADKVWWSQFADPPKTIGSALFSGNSNCYGVFWVDFTVTQVFPITSVRDGSGLPLESVVNQNFPNPFNPATIISYRLSATSLVSLEVFDLLGRKSATLVHEIQHAGSYSVRWDASGYPSGIYYYRLHAQPADGAGRAFSETRKMVLAR